ncbi:MAG: SPOR domain-containing protein [Bacteroidales bacterium]|nr:SPOR domain-containing protein [Bacteroidales bacterium]
MKTTKFLVVLFITMTLLSGCDFFRSLLGKPTSEDLELIAYQKEAAANAKADSINNINNNIIEVDTLIADNERVVESKSIVKQPSSDFNYRYYVVVGSFKNYANAERFSEILLKKNYDVKNFKFKNGYNMVSIFGSIDYYEAHKKLSEIMESEICPDDIWIYDTAQQLHE